MSIFTMFLQVVALIEPFATDLARERLYPCVNELMTFKLGRSQEFLSAVNTIVSVIFFPLGFEIIFVD